MLIGIPTAKAMAISAVVLFLIVIHLLLITYRIITYSNLNQVLRI